MCGIFGYVGKKDAAEIVFTGLKNLEYRGYDSWGISVCVDNNLLVFKKVGEVGDIESSEVKILHKSPIGIGHTRWATHGRVNHVNAHPHKSVCGGFSLVQNGIVENYSDLKRKYFSNARFKTQTDTEVIVKLIERAKRGSGDFLSAVRKSFLKLKGRNTIAILDCNRERLIAVRNGSPLVVGVGKGEVFLSSDTLSFSQFTNKIIPLDNMQMVEITREKINVFDVKSGRRRYKKLRIVDYKTKKISKEGKDFFYIKEVLEQPNTIRDAVVYTKDDFKGLVGSIRSAGTVYTVGAGTAGYAASQYAYFLRKYSGIQCIELKAYEAGSFKGIFKKGDMLIAVSQSGETADTLECVELARRRGLKICAVVNMLGSTLERFSDFVFYSRSGPEISVVSTKAFTAQISWGFLLSHMLIGKYKKAKIQIERTSEAMKKLLCKENIQYFEKIAKRLIKYKSIYVLGRGQNYNIALEGALKIKEISYIHAEGFAAGELKHGVISLIEEDVPVIVIASDDEEKGDTMNAAYEVKSRGAFVVGISDSKSDVFDELIKVPRLKHTSSIVNIVPIQVLGYFMAKMKGLSPDKPRNLAKSVTVK